MSREGGRARSLHLTDYHLTDFLHMACMEEGGAELVDALVCAVAQRECRRQWFGTEWRTQRLEGTPLFRAACIARYDSVQELVWQGASLKAPSTAMAKSRLQETTAGPQCHDAELAAVLHPSTYKWVLLCSWCALCVQHHSLTFQIVSAGYHKTLMVRRQTTSLLGSTLPNCAGRTTTWCQPPLC